MKYHGNDSEEQLMRLYDFGGPCTRKKLRQTYPELFKPVPGKSIIASVREKLQELRKQA